MNVLIRVASSASGQLFAFVLAERMGSRSGGGSLLAGAIGIAFYATELAGAPIAGRIGDERGHLRVLRWGPFFGTGAVLLGAFAALGVSSVAALAATLVMARLVEGASAACTVPTTLALLARCTDDDKAGTSRIRVMGLFEMASLGGMIGGYLLAGVIWDSAGGKSFLLLPFIYIASLAFARGKDDPGIPSTEETSWQALRKVMRERGSVGFTVAWLAVNAVVGIWLQQAPYLLKLPVRSSEQSLVGGYPAKTIGVIFAAWGVTFLAGIAIWSFGAPSWPRRFTLRVALIGMLAVVASLGFLNHGGSRWLLIIAAAAVIVESGFTPAAFAHLADITDTRDQSRGRAMGLYSLLLGFGQLIGAAVGAPFSARWQMDGVLAATGLLAGVALVGISRMEDTPRQTPSPAA